MTEAPAPSPQGPRWALAAAVAAVLAFVAWMTWPLWHTAGQLFTRGFHHHLVTPMWRLDQVARSLAAGDDLLRLTDFDWPAPVTRLETNIPSAVEFVMMAPVTWISDWPQQWGLAQALDTALIALAVLWLARILGCRGLGLAVAGCMGAVMWPLWHDLVEARLNAVWVWASFATVAAVGEALLAAEAARLRPTPGRWAILALMVPVVAGLGAQALLVYPFYAAIVAPLGLLVLAPLMRRGRWLGIGVALLGLGLGLALSAGELGAMLAWSPKSRVASCAPNFRCPWPHQVIPGELLLRLIPGGSWSLLDYNGAGLMAWALAPLALLRRGRRAQVALLLGVSVVFAALSLGPCPVWIPGRLPQGTILDNLAAPLVPLYCKLIQVKDWSRLTYGALGFSAGLTGLAVEALWRRGGPRARAAAVVVAALGVGHPTWLMRAELGQAANWSEVRVPMSVAFLAKAEPGPVAELPFDRTDQYLSVLWSPTSPRLNPATLDFLDTWPVSDQPFLAWLQRLGRGAPTPGEAPTVDEAQASGLRWVLFDPERCPRDAGGQASPACITGLPEALTAALGPGIPLGGLGALAWDVAALSSSGSRAGTPAPTSPAP